MTFKILIKSLIINVFLAILKIIASVLTKSKTLLADALHGLSDIATDIVGLVGAKIAAKKPDKYHPYGHGKMEYVTSIFISIFIISLGILIFKNSFARTQIIYSRYIFLIIPITICLKSLVSFYLIDKGKKLKSNILISSGTESKYDVLNTVFAFFIVILSYFKKGVPYLKYADMIGSIFISLFTIKVGLKMFFENTRSVLGEIEINKEKEDMIKEVILKCDEIKKVGNITLLKYGSYINLTVEVTMNANIKLSDIYQTELKLKKQIKKEFKDIEYITINIKPEKNYP